MGNNPINGNDPTGLVEVKQIPFVGIYLGIRAGINGISNYINNSLGKVEPEESPPVSYQTFINNIRGKTLAQIQAEGAEPGGVSSAVSIAGLNANYRYVRDPANPNYIIDMRHFFVIGPRGNTLGLGVEIIQGLDGQDSAFNLQDFYSNELGNRFFNGPLGYNPGQPLVPQLNQFFEGRQRVPQFFDNLLSTPTNTSGATSFLGGSGSFGGFVIYPNKSNTNMVRSVYAK